MRTTIRVTGGAVTTLLTVMSVLLLAPAARAHTVHNGLDVLVNVKLRPGRSDQNVPAKGREVCSHTNRGPHPAGTADAVQTPEVQTVDFHCVIDIQAGGTLRIDYFDEGGGAGR